MLIFSQPMFMNELLSGLYTDRKIVRKQELFFLAFRRLNLNCFIIIY